jgi:amidase
MTRTVRDAALMLGVLASGGADPRDPLTAGAQASLAADYTRLLDPGALRGVRVGVARNFFGFHEGVDRVMDDALRALREAGAVVVDPAPITTADKFGGTENDVLQFEFKADLNAYLAERLRAGAGRNAMGEPTPRTLAELIAFNERHRGREMPYFGQEIFVQSQARGPLSSPVYRRALAANHRLAGAQGIDAALAARRLDVLVAPTNGPAWSIDVVTGDHFSGGYSSPSAVAGYPHVTVPAGYVQGLPIGLSFFAGRFTETRLLAYAYAFEQATRQRRAPEFRSTLLA